MKKTEITKSNILDFRLSRFLKKGGKDMHSLFQTSNKVQTSTFTANNVLFNENSNPEGVFYLKRGRVRLIQHDCEGEQTELGHVPEGCYLGLSALIRNKKHSATAIAQSDCQLDFVPKQEFFRLMAKQPLFSHNILVGLCTLLTHTEEEIGIIESTTPREKLAQTLLVLFRNLKTEEKPPTIKLTLANLSKLINQDTDIIKAYLDEFQENNYLRIRGSSITLLNKKGLKQTIQSSKPTK